MDESSTAPGIIIAAPSSGSGKTTVTLGLLRHLARGGRNVTSFKVGPDYIDPAFHHAASGRSCPNLDPWAMRPQTIASIAQDLARDAHVVIGEGVMGMFDGAADGSGSTADLAETTGWPVVLVIDASGQSVSAAAVAHGFATFRAGVTVAGVICNRTGGDGHARLLREAFEKLGLPLLGCIPRADALMLPDRHLGLVQAREHGALDDFLDKAADHVGGAVDIDALTGLARPARPFAEASDDGILPPLGRHIAVANDAAFAFSYPHVLVDWRRRGAEIAMFSPLAGEGPSQDATAVFLPGGYPELHAGKLSANRALIDGLRAAKDRGAVVYGECGGYMIMGESLTDASGATYRMAGLLPLATSFAESRLHLGYRRVETLSNGPLGALGAAFRGHEFHYATVTYEGDGAPLFLASDARGESVHKVGRRVGSAMGSFIHLIDRA